MSHLPHDDESALGRFQTLLRIPTVSRLDESTTDWAVFDRFIAALPGLYPALHSVLEREIVAGHSLLYRWPGDLPGEPAVLMAHYDVVPAGDEPVDVRVVLRQGGRAISETWVGLVFPLRGVEPNRDISS